MILPINFFKDVRKDVFRYRHHTLNVGNSLYKVHSYANEPFRPYPSAKSFVANLSPIFHLVADFACDMALVFLDIAIGVLSAIKAVYSLLMYAAMGFTMGMIRPDNLSDLPNAVGDVFKSVFNIITVLADAALMVLLFPVVTPLAVASTLTHSFATAVNAMIPADVEPSWEEGYAPPRVYF